MSIGNKTHEAGAPSGPSSRTTNFLRVTLVSLSLVIFASITIIFIIRSGDQKPAEQKLTSNATTSSATSRAGGIAAAAPSAPDSPEAQPPRPKLPAGDISHELGGPAQKPVAGIRQRDKLLKARIRELTRSGNLKQLERLRLVVEPTAQSRSTGSTLLASAGVFTPSAVPRQTLQRSPVFSILRKPDPATKQGSSESAEAARPSSAIPLDRKQARSEKSAVEETVVPISEVAERVDAGTVPQRKLPTGSPAAPAPTTDGSSITPKQEKAVSASAQVSATGNLNPTESRLVQAAHSFNGDLRDLPQTPPKKRERPEREEPKIIPRVFEQSGGVKEPPASGASASATAPSAPTPSTPAPAPIANFDGLDFAAFGAGHPPDTNGDVGPTYYIETVNTSIGIYRKSDHVRVAAFTFDTFMSQGSFGNLCDTDNFGDPVVLYDTFEDRFVITDFAFQLDGSNNVINPPGAFQCFAVSKTGDPVLGGWNFYSINTTGGLGDYPKLGIWPDGLYLSVNMFDYAAAGSFQNVRAYAFNKAQMYAGNPTVQVVSFDAPSADFTILPSNARLQTGTPPAGTPNYFVSTSEFLNALTVYRLHVDWDRISTSTFTGPDIPLASTSWPNAAVPLAPSLGGNDLDTLGIRAMMQNQYSNIGGVESLWTVHTVRRANTSGFAAPRYYQVNVTGGVVNPNIPQAATWDPDLANVIHRFMPSVAVNRMGDMALGYSTSSSTTKPAIKYAGRLAADPVNTLSLTEQLLIQGAGTQTGSCGGTCMRWGDYSAMSLDPDGCTFWYTNEYYAVDGLNDLTRIGSFAFPSCTPVGSGGTVSGTVIATTGGAPISGATIAFGSRTTSTNGSGVYSFSNIPAGAYPSISASFPGYISGTSTPVAVVDSATTTKNFSLNTAPTPACLTDPSQSDFQTGVQATVDLTASPGNVTLSNVANLDQQNLSVTTSGVGFDSTNWFGQTFQPGVTGQLTRADIDLFCFTCTGTTPNITVSVRAASSDLPTGVDLATATIPGFSSGAGGFFAANFTTPPTLTAGTRYALVLRSVSDPSAGTYAYVISSGSPYANGRRSTSSSSGGTWNVANPSTDVGFITYMKTGFAASGNQVSGLKDANPPVAFTPNWTTLSWNATVPANTNLKFQVAASNSASGPFNFVGPDGTAATFFTTSGASISQFNGNRYLKYKAFLSTTDPAVTPTVNDVTVCFNDVAPTDATLNWFTADAYAGTAKSPNGGVLLRWQTGYEVANLGFHIYREEGGKRVRVTPDIVAGSALFAGASTVLGAGRSYAWRDSQGGNADSAYWLESIDLDGFSTWYGPVSATTADVKKASSAQVEPESKLIGELTTGAGDTTSRLDPRAAQMPMTIASLASSALVARQPAVKISVQREGWYRISQSELASAGLDPRVDPRLLQLSVDGQEQPINVVAEKDGRLSAVEFYGVGIDSPYTQLRTYWLTAGDQPGKRIGQRNAGAPDVSGGSFPYTVERRERDIYFSALRNGDKENFFGSIIARDPVDQSLTLSRVETKSSDAATLEVAVQGVTTTAHSVAVELNGSYAGSLYFNNQSEGVERFSLQPSQLQEGQNVLRLSSKGGPTDISLVDYVRLTYPHRYTAEGDALRFTVAGKQMATVDGFSGPNIRVFDITNPAAVQELMGSVQQQKSGSYAVSLNPQGAEPLTLLAIAGEMSKPVSLAPNIPSAWRQPGNGADLVILTRRDFVASLVPLASLRQKQGYSVALVDIEDVYDEFSYGQKTPQAVKDFLTYAAANWKKAPRFVMLAGDGSYDPKSYLGFGDSDLVPTKLIDTDYMETASDDWLVDFNGDGLPDMAIGRLPVRSANEAFRLANKIAAYDGQRSPGNLLLVSDRSEGFDFGAASNVLRGLIPSNIRIESVERDHLDDATAKARLIDAINRGQIIVNYSGHGSANQWRGDILTSADAAGLTNASELSMFVMMTCLNGYFQDAALDSLAESLLKANGGAVAVWGSSGLTTPDIQAVLNQQMYRMIFSGAPITIGEATARAKAAVTSADVRRTWILLGDPTTRLSK